MPEALIQQPAERARRGWDRPVGLVCSKRFHAWMRYVFFYGVAANAPFWYARWAGGLLPLGWVCVEYLLLGLMGLWLPSGVTAALLLLTTCADVVSAISGTFYLTPAECLRFPSSLTSLVMARVLLFSVAVLLVGLSAVTAVWLSPRRLPFAGRSRAAIGICVLVVCVAGSDLSSARQDARVRPSQPDGRGPVRKERFRRYRSLWLGRYTLVRLWREQSSSSTMQAVDASAPVQDGAMPHASSFAAAAAGIDSACRRVRDPTL